jgi:hypothetical protein
MKTLEVEMELQLEHSAQPHSPVLLDISFSNRITVKVQKVVRSIDFQMAFSVL